MCQITVLSTKSYLPLGVPLRLLTPDNIENFVGFHCRPQRTKPGSIDRMPEK